MDSINSHQKIRYDFHRALFIQIKQAGDCLLSTPAIRAFKKAYPKCEVHYLVGKYLAGILEGNCYIDKTIIIENSGWLSPITMAFSLRHANYDLAIDFLSNPTSSKLAFISGAKVRVGYKLRGRSWAYNMHPANLDPNEYAASSKLHLLEAIGIKMDGLKLDFSIIDESINKAAEDLAQFDTHLLAVVPVSRREYKRWPLEKYSDVLDRVANELNLVPMLLCGPGEIDILNFIGSKMKTRALIREMNSFQQFGAYLHKAKMLFGNDNGPKHIAVALGIPTLAIMGHLNPFNWTEPNNPKHIFVSRELECKFDCNPRKCRNFKCIEDISEEQVYLKLKEHWLKAIQGEDDNNQINKAPLQKNRD
ncbi:MAG: hypothetical protein CO189_07170 [candidate division Zixibacteria bacterium CG_4_9_14_3_um_filter_46_8]|nr:MAG: hypothetical protein CO189_07170 [candidate division Zixibacteria bacterium CG_4_9_14_3_um_filter_46_8]